MFMKKLLMIIPVFLFAFALTASADGCCPSQHHMKRCCPSVDVTNFNGSIQGAEVNANANTGYNNASGNWGLGKIDTGNATTRAELTQQAGFNTVEVGTPWAPFNGSVSVRNSNFAAQVAKMNARANTGYNNANDNKGVEVNGSLMMSSCIPTIKVSGATTGAGKITTGNASVTAGAWQTTGVSVVKVNAAPTPAPSS